MILHCNFEELLALRHGADATLQEGQSGGEGGVAAPPEALAALQQLLPRLDGALSVRSLAEQRRIRSAVAAVHDHLHARLDNVVVENGPASEDSVCTYFDYAYVRIVLDRLDAMGAEMEAMVELISGAPPTADTAAAIDFPD